MSVEFPEEALLSGIVSDVASAVASTQTELDKIASDASGNLHLAPVAFILEQTEVALVGTLSLERVHPLRDPARSLTFSQVNRVQAGLRGDRGAALRSVVSVSILAVEPSRRGL